MLGKLIKHEFRATARTMGPMLLAALVLSLLAGVSGTLLGGNGDKTSIAADIIITLAMMLFVVAVIALAVMSVVIMIQRFYRNLLTDEGYIMETLPVSVHGLVWSKLIVSTVWFAATFVAIVISVCLAALIANVNVAAFNLADDWQDIRQMIAYVTDNFDINVVAYALEFLLLAIVGSLGTCLLFYAAISTGYGFPKHKVFLSVLFFFAFQTVMQIIGTIGQVFIIRSSAAVNDLVTAIELANNSGHAVLWAAIALAAIFDAGLYFITVYNLKNRINLE